MKVLVLTKRRYMHHDLIGERYGRLYHLPEELAARGHAVEVLCLHYGLGRNETLAAGEDGRPVTWRSVPLLPFGPSRYRRLAGRRAKALGADVIFAMSDPLYGMWARSVARRRGAAFAFDLYDNFETWTSMRLPGVPRGYARALGAADLVSCVSERLSERVRRRFAPRGEVITVESVVDSERFRPLDRAACRAELGLPEVGKVVGYIGSLGSNRSVEDLLGAWRIVAERQPDALLLLAGQLDRGVALPGEEARVRHLGMQPWARVPVLINACDVVTVINFDSAFGRYCFPQKLCESLACGVPVVATEVGAVGDFLRRWPQCLYPLGDSEAFADRILGFLADPAIDYGSVPTWTDVAGPLEEAMQRALARRRERAQDVA